MLNALVADATLGQSLRAPRSATQLFNARPILASALFNPFLMSWSSPTAFARTDNSSRSIPWRYALTLIVLFTRSRLSSRPTRARES